MRHINAGYSSGYPICVGDDIYAQDILRDFRFMQSEIGKQILSTFQKTAAFVISGIFYKQGAGHTLTLGAGRALLKLSVTKPHETDAWILPPSTATEDIYVQFDYAGVTNGSLAGIDTAGATNYVKLSVAETNGNTRTRIHTSGSYAYEVYLVGTLTINTTAPAAYEVELCRFTSNGSILTFTGEGARVNKYSMTTPAALNISAGNQVTDLSGYERGGASELESGAQIKVSWTGGNKTYSHKFTGTAYTIGGLAIANWWCYGTGNILLELDKANANWKILNDANHVFDIFTEIATQRYTTTRYINRDATIDAYSVNTVNTNTLSTAPVYYNFLQFTYPTQLATIDIGRIIYTTPGAISPTAAFVWPGAILDHLITGCKPNICGMNNNNGFICIKVFGTW